MLAHAERCRARRDELAGAEVALEAATAELGAARAAVAATRRRELRAARAQAAPRLAAAVRERARRAGDGGRRRSRSSWASARSPARPAPTRSSSCIAPNPGVPAAPLRETASGGELSRVMLALLGVANDGSRTTLVFDEVDAGIGGQTARAVGEQLRALAARPPGRLHHAPAAGRLARRAPLLDREGRARRAGAHDGARSSPRARSSRELVRMLGADDDDVAARRHARELLQAA